MSRLITIGLASFAFFAVTVRAQDDLGSFRVRQEIAAQKLTKLVADTLSDSRRIERSDPREALSLLRRTMDQVRSSLDLGAEKKASLIRQLQVRSNEVDDSMRARTVGENLKPLAQRPAPRTPTYDEPRSKGKGVGSVIDDFQGPARLALKTAYDADRTRLQNINRINNSIEKTPPYPTDDRPIVFPSRAEWERITARGKPRLTEKEANLLKALNSVMSVNYRGTKFGAVIEHIQDKSGIAILVDEASKQEARLDYEDVVDFSVPGKLSVRTILKKVLADKGLTYVIKEGAIQVVTPKKAREMVVVRSYPISDLIAPNQMAMMYGPYVARAQMLQNVQQLINLIQTTVDPAYWEPNGPGSIGFYEPAQSLIIRGSAEMHYQLGGMSLLGR